MSKDRKSAGETITAAAASPFSSPFASLEKLRSELPAAHPAAASPSAKIALAQAQRGPARAVVRMERKGRGGKEVTVVEQLELSDRELAAWLKALKGSLGCGGAIEERALVLQGDHRERTRKLLEERGVRKVIAG
jgi:translation initiation factor 1